MQRKGLWPDMKIQFELGPHIEKQILLSSDTFSRSFLRFVLEKNKQTEQNKRFFGITLELNL